MNSPADFQANAPLHQAISRGDAQGVLDALAAGADINGPEVPKGLTPLQLTAEFCSAPMFDLLVQQGADLRAAENATPTLLELVLAKPRPGAADFVKAALAAGVDPNRPLSDGSSLLHRAVMLSDPAVAQQLLGHGANPNALDNSRSTPLHHAVHGFRPRHGMVFVLATYGADIHAVNAQGLNALDLAASAGSMARSRAGMLLALGATLTAHSSVDGDGDFQEMVNAGPLQNAMTFDEPEVLIASLERHVQEAGFEREIQRAANEAEAANYTGKADLMRSFLARHAAAHAVDQALQSLPEPRP